MGDGRVDKNNDYIWFVAPVYALVSFFLIIQIGIIGFLISYVLGFVYLYNRENSNSEPVNVFMVAVMPFFLVAAGLFILAPLLILLNVLGVIDGMGGYIADEDYFSRR